MNSILKKLLAVPAVKTAKLAVYAARADRAVHPEGEFDSAGRFYPADSEKHFDSFAGIRRPTRSWPYSYMLRARTRDHCGLLVLASLVPANEVPADVRRSRMPDAPAVAAESLLPKPLRFHPDGVALAYTALLSLLESLDGFKVENDVTRWLVLADWIADHGHEKHVAWLRAAIAEFAPAGLATS